MNEDRRGGRLRNGLWALWIVVLAVALAVPFAFTGVVRAQTIGWTNQFGVGAFTIAWDVVVDDDAVYAMGDTDFALPGQTNLGGVDLWLRKYDEDGTLEWTRQFGTAGDDFAFGGGNLAVDDDAIYVSGFVGAAFPGQAFAGGPFDAFVRKYDSDGNVEWTRQFGTDTFDDVHGLAADDGAVYLAGSTQAALPGQTYAGGEFDGFLRKYDDDGNEEWTRQYGTPGSDHPLDVAVDDDDVYTGGWTDGTLPGQASAGGADAFIRMYDEDGDLEWTDQFGSPAFDEIFAISVDDDEVYAHGDTQGALPGHVSLGPSDVFLRKYDDDGNVDWTRQFGSSGFDLAGGVSAEDDVILVTGQAGGSFPGQAFLGGFSDVYAMQFDEDGDVEWTLQFGTSGFFFDFGLAVSMDDDDVAFVGGAVAGALPGETFSGGLLDGFVIELELDDDDDDDDEEDDD